LLAIDLYNAEMTALRLTRYNSAAKFLEKNRAFLLEREAENNLMLSIAFGVESGRLVAKGASYFGSVEEDGRILATAVMTPPQQAVLARSEHEEAVRMLAGDIWSFHEATPGVHGPRPTGAWFSDAWSALTSREPRLSLQERLYRLEHLRPVPTPPGSARPAQPADWPLLAQWQVAFQREALPHQRALPREADLLVHWQTLSVLPPSVLGQWVWVARGDVVSYVAYGSATPNGMRIGPVYTPPEARGRGYATALTARVSQEVLDQGKHFVTLFTDLANPTSNKIYQTIGYAPIADFDEYAWD
jgi:hypothetical protein